jgi:HEAT repeat protein
MERKWTLDELLAAIRSDDENARTEAWLGAGTVGASAIRPLAKLIDKGELEVGRAAKRAVWKIVRTAGAPGNAAKSNVVEELCGLLGNDQSNAVRREVVWMLSEIGGDEAVQAFRDIPEILENAELREDVRCAVQRIPTPFARDTLVEGLEAAPEDFKLAMAQACRARGVDVDQTRYPCQKLVPTKQTDVKPVGR